VSLAYGPDGKSRGEATVIFSKPGSAAEAHKEYNNVGVDGRPMRVSTLFVVPQISDADYHQIELVGGSTVAPAAMKGLADRMA